MRVQIVCKRTTVDPLREQIFGTFGRFSQDLDFIQRRGHVLVELPVHAYHPDLLRCCRMGRYAYARLTEIEAGGLSLTGSGSASCVAGLEGQPLEPGSTWTEPNGAHAVFTDREGVLVAISAHADNDRILTVSKTCFQGSSIKNRTLIEIEWSGSFESALTKTPDWYGQYAPLMRAAVRKSNCIDCTHVHYRTIDDVEETDGGEKYE